MMLRHIAYAIRCLMPAYAIHAVLMPLSLEYHDMIMSFQPFSMPKSGYVIDVYAAYALRRILPLFDAATMRARYARCRVTKRVTRRVMRTDIAAMIDDRQRSITR